MQVRCVVETSCANRYFRAVRSSMDLIATLNDGLDFVATAAPPLVAMTSPIAVVDRVAVGALKNATVTLENGSSITVGRTS